MSEWQTKLDEWYPYGASVTVVDDVPEGVGLDESTSFLTTKFTVVEDGEQPSVQLIIYGIEKDFTFVIESVEEFSPGVRLVHTPEGEKDVLISTNIEQEVLNALRKARKEAEEA